jgi:hypothetical protein
LFLARMDVAMTQPSTFNRGTTISELCNALELANDSALRFGLDLERKGTKLRKVRRPKNKAADHSSGAAEQPAAHQPGQAEIRTQSEMGQASSGERT